MKTILLVIVPIMVLAASIFLVSLSPVTPLTIINKSSATLTNVIASGSGFSLSVNDLNPGEQRQIMINPRGESELSLTFDANGKHFPSTEQGYFENGYKITAVIDPDFAVKVDATIPANPDLLPAVAETISGLVIYFGGFFPTYFFVKRKLRKSRLLSILAGILGLCFWGFMIFLLVEFSCHLWESHSNPLYAGWFLIGLAPYLLTYFIISKTRSAQMNSPERRSGIETFR